MKNLATLFAILITTTFLFNGVIADQHTNKKLEKQQHKEMKKAAKDNAKSHRYKKQSGDDYNGHIEIKMDRKHGDDNHDMGNYNDEKQGLKKQQEKKASQERKEEGKGSEQGQSSREEHSKKWWKFWGE